MSDLLIYKGIEEEKRDPWEIVIHTLAELDDAWSRYSARFLNEELWTNRWVSAPARSNYVINIQGDVARSE